LFSQDRGVIFADAVPAVATRPPTVIAAAKSAAIALRFMLPPFGPCPSHPDKRSRGERRYAKRVADSTSRGLRLPDYVMCVAADALDM
jgi:hypothetical protein